MPTRRGTTNRTGTSQFVSKPDLVTPRYSSTASTNGSPSTLTVASHGLPIDAGVQVVFHATSGLDDSPVIDTANTPYYVKALTADTVAVYSDEALTTPISFSTGSGTSTFMQTLNYPITITGDSVNANYGGIAITGAQTAPLGQNLFRVEDSSGAIKFIIGVTGGPLAIASDIRVAHASGESYAAFNGTETVPCLELPDGTASQGSKIWSGTGAPSASTVGTAAIGDYYFRRGVYEPASLLAATELTGTTTTLSVGSGTVTGSQLKSGVPAAGDLLIVVSGNTNATETMTIGATSGITAASGDGGFTANDGTRYLKFFSHVIQSADISSNLVTVTSSSHTTGTGRRICAFIFRHTCGWSTTGSKFGCPTFATDSATGSNATETHTIVGPSGPSISVAGGTRNAAETYTALWDSGSSTDTTTDSSSGCLGVSVKPGLGINTSGASAYTTGGSSVDIGSMGASNVSGLVNWQPATPVATQLLYVCTAGGAPGTWRQVI
jgi:hypothetical protein